MARNSQCTISVTSSFATWDLCCGALAAPAFSEVPTLERIGALSTGRRCSPEIWESHRVCDRFTVTFVAVAPKAT